MSSPLAPFRAQSSALEPKNAALEQRDHGSFHGTVMRSVVGAGTGALIADLACRLGGSPIESSKLFVILAAAGAFAGIAVRGRRWLTGAIGGGLGVLGSFAASLAAQWAPFSAAILGASAAPVLGEGESPKRKLVTALAAGAFGYAGLHVAEVILQAGVFGALVPGPLAVAAAGATAGLFIGLASAPRHLVRSPDPVEDAYAVALATRDGEIHELLERALHIHRAVRAELDVRGRDRDGFALEAQVGEQLMRILRIAEHCRRIDHDLSGDAMYRLEDRIAVLEQKAGATLDPSARATYEQALGSLDAQREALRRLGDGRERVVARLHVNVALLEKLRISLLQLRSADAERWGAESSPVAEALEELGRELDATADAITEVFGRPVGPALPRQGGGSSRSLPAGRAPTAG